MEKLKIAGQNGWAFWRPGPWCRLGWNPEHRWKVWHLDWKDLPSFKIGERLSRVIVGLCLRWRRSFIEVSIV